MKLYQITSAITKTRTRIVNNARGVQRFAKLERFLAAVCIFIPLFLIWFDDKPKIRERISDYYNMTEPQMFYFPLTVASMLFIVNGVVKYKSYYISFLGIALAGLILFNLKDWSKLHYFFAATFFVGNVVVILTKSSKKELWFKALLISVIVLSMLGYFIFHWFDLFWAEWLSLVIISLHFIIESCSRGKLLKEELETHS